MKIGAVKDQVFVLAIIERLSRNRLKPVVLDKLEFELAVPGDSGELSDRIAFGNPELEPLLLLAFFRIKSIPNICFSTSITSKTLLA